MEIAKKMFLTVGDSVLCVHLPSGLGDADLDLQQSDFNAIEVARQTGQVKAVFVFVKDAADLEANLNELTLLWESRVTFWLFYPKKPHLNTDLGRDATWKLMRRAEMNGTRQVAVNDQWSCLYFKNSGKTDFVEIA